MQKSVEEYFQIRIHAGIIYQEISFFLNFLHFFLGTLIYYCLFYRIYILLVHYHNGLVQNSDVCKSMYIKKLFLRIHCMPGTRELSLFLSRHLCKYENINSIDEKPTNLVHYMHKKTLFSRTYRIYFAIQRDNYLKIESKLCHFYMILLIQLLFRTQESLFCVLFICTSFFCIIDASVRQF